MFDETSNSQERALRLPPQNEVGLAPVDEVSLGNVSTSSEGLYRGERLEKAKNDKLKALTNVSNSADLDDSYTDMGNGYLESNRNKMWNDMSDKDIQSLWATAIDKYKLDKDAEGNVVDAQGNPYSGYTRRLYDFGTKAQTSEARKFGLARGDAEDATARYVKYPSGELGADINRMYGDALLPNDVATMLEATLHGRKRSLENRVMKDRFADPFTADDLGGGSSEYYTSKEGAFGVEGETDSELGAKLFDEYMAKLPQRYRKKGISSAGEYDPTIKPIGNRLVNTLSGFGSTFVNELVVKPLDAIGDLTGLYDLDEDGDTQKSVEDAFGYSSKPAEDAIHKIGEHWDTASNNEASTVDRVKAAGNGILEALTTPEMLGTSLGALMSWITPGAVLKAVGVGSKYANTASRIDNLVDAGKLTSRAGKVKKAQAFMSADGAKAFLTSQSGFIASSLGNVNKQYEEFVANNNGTELNPEEKAKWFAGRFAVQMVNQNLDKIVDINVMKSPGVLKALVPAVKAMSNKEFTNVVKHMAKGVAKSSASASSEAAQEYAQTSMELFNSRFGSAKFEDLDTFTKFLSDDENIREGGIAALAGAGGAGQFEAVGTVLPAATFGTKFVADKTAGILADRETTGTPASEVVEDVSEDDVKKAKSAYGALLTRTVNYAAEHGVNEKNVGTLLEDLDELNRTKHVIKSSDPEQVAAGEAFYGKVVDQLEEFITKNPSLKLTKRLVRKTVDESAAGKKLGSAPSKEVVTDPDFDEVEYDDYTRKVEAERIMRTVLGSGKKFTSTFKTNAAVFGLSNGMSKNQVKEVIKSYESVETEATTGNRGYSARLNRLQVLTSSSNPNEAEITRERKDLDRMYNSILNSETALERGIEAAEQEAVKLNKRKNVNKNTVPVPTEYMKYNPSTRTYSEPYVINIKNRDGVWTADVEAAKNLQATKNRYTTAILEGLQDIDARAPKKTEPSVTTSGAVTVPVKEGKNKSLRQADINYLDDVSEKVSKALPKTSGVTKIILGQKTHDKWSTKGDYYKANKGIINSTKYTSDDVVLIDSIDVKEVTNDRGTYHNAVLGKEATKAVAAARKAGATIVFDSAMFKGKQAAKSPQLVAALKKKFNLPKFGYEPLTDGDKYIFVKTTDDNADTVKEYKTSVKKEKIAKESLATNKIKAVSLHRALDEGRDVSTGKLFTATTRAAAVKEYKAVRKALLESSFSDETKLDSFLERETVDSVAKAADKILKDPESVPLNYDDVVFQQAVEEYIAAEENKDAEGAAALISWNETADKGLSSAARETEVGSILKNLGLKAKELITDIFDSKSFVKGKNDLYESVYQNVYTGQVTATPLRSPMTKEEYDRLMKANNEAVNKKKIFLGTRRVVQDLTKIANVSKTTVANSLTPEFLPYSIRSAVEDFTASAKKRLAKVSPAELAPQTYNREADGTVSPGGFNLHNSPARGLFFNNEGKLNVSVMTATYLALGAMLVSDKTALSIGFKSDHDVAQTFGVQEYELTNEMREFAYQHGSLLKTAASKLGKNVLTQLGITKRIDSETSSHEYEALASDIGNTALLIAESEGLMESNSVDSNTLAELYRDGQENKAETKTHFVNLSGFQDPDSEYSRNIPSDEVDVFLINYEEAIEGLPEAATTRKDGHFYKPNKETLEEAKTTVRNDVSGKEVPAEAQETIEILMKTPYSADLERIDEILDAVEAEGSNVKKLLGYVDLESAEFDALYFKDKEVQEAKNNAVDKTIDELRLLKERLVERGDKSKDIYFDYFYASNDRYMMDANTVNPQVDKLHRFLITPKNHKLDYKVKVNDNGGIEFRTGPDSDVNSDQSFTVRMALAQAFGKGVDKMDAEDIIDFGNVMLSLTPRQLKDVRKQVLSDGEFVLKSDGKEYEGEAEHLSHTLQALKFLEESQAAITSDGKMSSSLSLEFDSLTSGFANKTQQMPILDDMDEHFARTGVLTLEYQRRLREALNYKGDGVAFDPKNGQSMADVIASGDDKTEYSDSDNTVEFLDSYKNMAKTTILKLRENVVQQENLSHGAKIGGVSGFSVFEAIKPILPGGESIDAGDSKVTITDLIRKLFKNPFMIFNYSAGIARITRNLGNDVAHDIAKNLATKDLRDEKNAGLKDTAERLLETVNLVDDNGDAITSAAKLQEVLRTTPLEKVMLKKPFLVESPSYSKENKSKPARNLEELLENTVKATYGEVVKEVFTENFKEFIEVQDAMNDTFKIAFRIFDKKRIDRLKELQVSKDDKFLSVEDHMNVLEELRDDFPWIVGPLTETGGTKAVISVATTTTRPSNPIEESRKKPQAVLAEGGKTATRTVTPLVKYLEEAVSSGSVLPFHAIDGAEIAKTLISMGIKSIAAIHDAVIPPLNESDRVGFEYQKGMADINRNYVLAEELGNLVTRMNKTISDSKFATEFKEVTSQNIKLFAENKEVVPFPHAAKAVTAKMMEKVEAINTKREEWYGKGGKLEGAWYGNLVGTPGGMYQEGMTEPDLSYKTSFKDKYKSPKVSVNKATPKEETQVYTENFTTDAVLLKDLGYQVGLEKGNTKVDDIVDVLEHDSTEADRLVERYKKKLSSVTTTKLKADLNELIDKLSLFGSDDIIEEPVESVDENTSDKDAKFAGSSAIINNLKGCTK